MLVRRNLLKVALLTTLFATLVASNALAAGSSCLRKGERIYATGSGMVYVAKPISSRATGWSANSESILACSFTHKVRIPVGAVGKNQDKAHTIDHPLGDPDYAAFVSAGRGLSGVRVVNLSSGQIMGQYLPLSVESPASAEITSFVLGEEGNVGWIAVGRSAQGASLLEVRKAPAWLPAQNVADGPSIDPYLLRFSEGKFLTWSPATSALAIQSRIPVQARAKKSGSCIRGGESVVYSGSGSVVTKRSIRKSSWTAAYKLTACSTRFHRRVALGTFGERFRSRFSAVGIQANSRFVAFSTEVVDEDSMLDYSIRGYDLATGKLILSRSDGSPLLRLDQRGNIAWIAYYGPPRGGSGSSALNLFDARGVTKLVETGAGDRLDPWFIAFADGASGTELHYASLAATHR